MVRQSHSKLPKKTPYGGMKEERHKRKWPTTKKFNKKEYKFVTTATTKKKASVKGHAKHPKLNKWSWRTAHSKKTRYSPTSGGRLQGRWAIYKREK